MTGTPTDGSRYLRSPDGSHELVVGEHPSITAADLADPAVELNALLRGRDPASALRHLARLIDAGRVRPKGVEVNVYEVLGTSSMTVKLEWDREEVVRG